MSKNYLDEVRLQYENLPYPERDPTDEKNRLILTNLDLLPRINHYCFNGSRDFSQNFNVLVAGGGTGDSVIYLAEQLKNTNAKITYLDISKSSMSIAKKRAKVRELDNITWTHGSILDLNANTHGIFDYINCSGVLHHLEDPVLGLQKLKSVLAANGAMGIMVYAKYGRTAIYQVQDLMKLINGHNMDIKDKIENTNSMLESLPSTNWLKRSEDLHNDHKKYGDIGIYDLFLHSQDRAYSIPELFEWLKLGNVKFINFAGNKSCYDPRRYISNKILLNLIHKKPKWQQYAITELISGSIIKHAFYCGNKKNSTATLSDTVYPLLHNDELRKNISSNFHPENYGQNFIFNHDTIKITIPIIPATYELFKQMDGKRTLGEIIKKSCKKLKSNSVEKSDLKELFYGLCDMLINIDELSLSRPF